MLAFTQEWIDAVAEVLRNDETYQRKAKGFDSSFQFVVKADPKKGVAEDRACGLNLPACDKAWIGAHDAPDYTMTGSYGVFHGIVTGKTGAVMAITTRKVKVQGNLAKLLKYTGATNRFVEVLREVGTEFEGDFA